MSLKIPEKNGELLCIPPPSLIPRLIKSNKDKFETYNFYINGIHVHDFRKKVREQVLKLSRQYTAALALTPPIPPFKTPPNSPSLPLFNKEEVGGVKGEEKGGVNGGEIILTGHQPIFYHPGILVKNLLLNKVGREENITAINLIVDTDSFKEITVNIPVYNNNNKINRETFLSSPSPIPYELSPAPSWDTFKLFCGKIENHLSYPQFNNLREKFLKFMRRAGEGKRDFKTLSDFMTFIRRRYEEEIDSQYLEIPLSKICDIDEFIVFFISIVRDAESFVSIYNCHLSQYRKEHKLRYPANPFPDLSMDNKRLELPFWHLGFPPARGRIFVEDKDDVTAIYFENGVEISFKKGETDKVIEIIKKNKIKIRPRAITLTLFNRMFVSDVFIHGVGGAKYDRMTDGIIRDFYKVEPPEFITASLTLHPSIPLSVAQGFSPDSVKELERKLRDMKYNPERYIEDKQMVFNILEEKKSLLSMIENENASKREISIQLKEINDRLYRIIKPAADEIEEKIEILKKQQQEMEATQRRDYPYFLFSPEEIAKIIPPVFL